MFTDPPSIGDSPPCRSSSSSSWALSSFTSSASDSLRRRTGFRREARGDTTFTGGRYSGLPITAKVTSRRITAK